MGDKTSIPWTDATWNPVTGCSKVSRGCANCYAERQFHRPYPGRDFTDVQCHTERLDQPTHWKKPRKIMVPSMGDLFHRDVPDAFLDQVFAVMTKASQHIFQIPTKRPERMAEYVCKAMLDEDCRYDGYYEALDDLGIPDAEMPLNIWPGVSVEDQASAGRLDYLAYLPAYWTRWVSAEPLLGPVDLSTQNIDWLVCGGESGPHARTMDIAWARYLMEQCRYAHIPFFMKQVSQADAQKTFRDFESFPADLQVREYPKGVTI